MKNTISLILLICCTSLLFTSCSKETAMDPLSTVLFPKDGIIRIECSDCSLTYTVLKDNYAINVANSEDIKFSYVSSFELKTSVNSKTKQNIRLAIFDSRGRIVSNELSTVEEGTSKVNTFSIKAD
ncbi:hypothetical protein ACSBL2_07130 [Pedobacter sp. AW31-3R]|uniref:hypothetical protein n=1 Tax=Pedobacter sp. AW31-3R TaxID=3445781 RepID=UPI003F9FAF6F